MRWWGGRSIALCLLAIVVAGQATAAPLRTPAVVLFDVSSGQTLREQDAEGLRSAGSLYQLMVMLLTLEQANLGTMRLDVPVTVGDAAQPQARTVSAAPRQGAALRGLGLHPQRPYLLSDLLKAVAVIGSDEAAIAVAEAISGSAAASIEAMNARAQRLGLTATRYVSLANGSNPKEDSNQTCARDVARLAQALLTHPQVSEWATLSGLPFDDGGVLLRNANPLLGTVPGVDGLHVGQTPASGKSSAGYHAVVTATRGSMRLAAVVVDAPDSDSRFRAALDLLEWGFARYERVEVVKRGERLNVPVEVEGGAVQAVTPIAGETFAVVRLRGEERNFQVRYQLPTTVIAPLERQQPVGEIIIEERGQVLAVIPALSPASVSATGVLSASVR